MGATRELDELRTLVERCSSTPVLVGFIHGDLHASNVRVRATDAIVIDFFACKEAPLLFELACLEASLLVDGFGDVRINEIDAWFRSIRPLYEQYPLATPAAHANSWDRWSWFCSCVLRDRWRWFRSCVRQIRSHARGMERGSNQYAAALAVALLMKATKDSKVSEPEASRYAAAYVLAEVVLSKAIEHRVEAQ
jgi:Ser/Thr protein kinase RdoA (MazF antagonist)